MISSFICVDSDQTTNSLNCCCGKGSHFLHSKTNAKVIGKFKDETNGVAPLEFVGLRNKMYSLLLPGEKEKKPAKGVYEAKSIRHADYKKCLFEELPTSSTFHNIGSFEHGLHTTKIAKAALSPYDDKRYLIN